jgi:riboflavin synthase
MFTGIIQETGRVAALERRGGDLVMALEAPRTCSALVVGGSVAVNGCCLTAVSVSAPRFTVEAVPETLSRTDFNTLKVGSPVNLELPVTLQDMLGGHLVSGHVDALGEVVFVREEGGGQRWTVRLPKGLMKYVVEKGSISLDGISLTVAALDGDRIEVALIPHTLQATNLSSKGPGSKLHVEADLVAKHIERLTSAWIPGVADAR